MSHGPLILAMVVLMAGTKLCLNEGNALLDIHGFVPASLNNWSKSRPQQPRFSVHLAPPLRVLLPFAPLLLCPSSFVPILLMLLVPLCRSSLVMLIPYPPPNSPFNFPPFRYPSCMLTSDMQGFQRIRQVAEELRKKREEERERRKEREERGEEDHRDSNGEVRGLGDAS